MNRKGKVICALLLVQLLAWGVFVPTADAGGLKRLSAQFRRFAVDYDFTTAGASSTPGTGGIQVYTKSFNIPTPKSGQQAVVFVTISATIDTTGNLSLFSCEIDAAFCNPGIGAPVGSYGWVITEPAYVGREDADRERLPTVCGGARRSRTASIRMA